MNLITNNPITSLGTGLIPFIEHNDANRTLMGANMQRQALPLLKKEIAQINTGVETQITKASQYCTLTKNSGIIKFSNTKHIQIKKVMKPLTLKNNKSNLKKYKNKIIKTKLIKLFNYQLEKYSIRKIKKSNQNTYFQETKALTKKWAKKGQILLEGNGTHQGKLCLGKNILIGYMSWEGYNFEDAVIINKNLIDTDIFTSISTKRDKFFLIKNEKEGVRFRNNV